MIAQTENILVTGTVPGNCHLLVTDQSRAEQSRVVQYELKIEDLGCPVSPMRLFVNTMSGWMKDMLFLIELSRKSCRSGGGENLTAR